MGQWKLGYVNGLDSMATYENGMAEYHPFGAKTLTLDTTKMCRAVGVVNNVYSNRFNCTNIVNYPNIANSDPTTAFESDEFNSGFVRILSGAQKDDVYKITDTTNSTLYVSSTTGITSGNRFEAVTGSCTFEFSQNPTRRDFKRIVMNKSIRYPYYGGGLVIPIGWQPDDFMIKSILTDSHDADRLEVMLNHILDYKGLDGLYTVGKLNDNPHGFAPMILETGLNYAQYQHLVNVFDYTITKDAKKSDDYYNVEIHFEGFNTPIYRGL